MPYDPKFIPGCNLRLPVLGPTVSPVTFNAGQPIEHEKFSILFHQGRQLAIACASTIDGASIIPAGTIKRKSFIFDPDVPNSIQLDNNQGYHKNPWADMEVWKELQVETEMPSQPKKVVSQFRHRTERGWSGSPLPPVGVPVLCYAPFAPGRHFLTVSAEGFMPVEVTAVIRPGEITDVDVAMRLR